MASPVDQIFRELKSRTTGEVRELICVLESYVCVQEQRIADLEQRVRELEGQVKKDSTNSGKPPSSDGLKRTPKSLREKSGRRPGGQSGREGKALEFSATPDVVEKVPSKSACECGESLHGAFVTGVERRQVVDVPRAHPLVTEYQGARVKCACCGKEHAAEFPGYVTTGVSYGTNIRAVALLLLNEHLIPYARVSALCEELFGIPISVGSLSHFQQECFESLQHEEAAIKEEIIESKTASFDETGTRCEKKTLWCHSASTESATHYAVHYKRGEAAMQEIGILPRFGGIAVHDHWSAYFRFSCLHALCNAHHLRELKFLEEVEKESWALALENLLKETLHEVHNAERQGLDALSESAQVEVSARYDVILAEGLAYHNALPEFTPTKAGKRGRKKQRPGKNLLDRLLEHKEDVLRFAADFRVPFTNNLGERDLRMQKVKQKISGCFRTITGARMFCRIRGFISTAKKRALPVLQALRQALAGHAVFASLIP